MDRIREKTMSKGVLLFAFNSPKFNYYSMAVATAKRINHFLDLPVTVVTDEESIPNEITYTFDNTIKVVPDKQNRRDWGVWINKGRYQAYDLSPYDETLLLDTDYMVNSDKLLTTFNLPTDFCCHDTTSFLMHPGVPQEMLSVYSFNTLWATAVMFKKTKRAEQIFKCLELVQKNFDHYANIHGFISVTFRNDYALTLATRIANGHTTPIEDIIPWNLLHVGKNTSVYRNNEDESNTEYTVMFDNWNRGKIRKEYITIKDMDFHVMNKENFMELISE
jgi:hypothetical protein